MEVMQDRPQPPIIDAEDSWSTSRSSPIAARILNAVAHIQQALPNRVATAIDAALDRIAAAVTDQATVLRRIPEHMDHRLYHRSFRKHIRFFEDVHYYEGVARESRGS